jgi:hypothetical protein
VPDVVITLAVAAVIAVVVTRQLKGEPLRARRVVLLPAILIVAGAVSLDGTAKVGAADVVCIVASALVAVAIGLGQGATMHLESRDGGLWGRMPRRGLWLWAALIASRLVVAVIAAALGAKAASSVDSILLVLGINRLAQAAVIAARAVAAGVPFSLEKDGKTFLPGLLGQPAQPPAERPSPTYATLPRSRNRWTPPAGPFERAPGAPGGVADPRRPVSADTAPLLNGAKWTDVVHGLVERFWNTR